MPPKRKKYIDPFRKTGTDAIDYKNPKLLADYITYHRSIQSRFHTGTGVETQKKLANEIKKARVMGLLPFVRYEK